MTNEPTTGEIVRALRFCNLLCSNDCFYRNDGQYCRIKSRKDAADRLESQEREIERLNEELDEMQEAATVLHAANETHWTYIKELTARAESAERERDAIALELDMMRANENENGLCLICKKKCAQAANGCFFCKDFEWRGLQPQDGGAE